MQKLKKLLSPNYSTILSIAGCDESTSAKTSQSDPEHIAVVGAGITGLTAAYYLNRRFPNTRITVLESQPRVGGWIQSKAIDLGNEYGKMVLEAGPRTLRSVSKPLIELVSILTALLTLVGTKQRLIDKSIGLAKPTRFNGENIASCSKSLFTFLET